MGRWSLVESARARLVEERGTLLKDAPLRVALCYPSPYHVGMSSLGFQTIYREIHEHDGATAERAFLPDDLENFRKSGAPLFTCETEMDASQAQVMAFSVAYELEITGLLDMLTLAGIPVFSHERTEAHPLVVAGGPLTFSNPAPLEPFVDLVLLGEAEESIHTLLNAIQSSHRREDVLSVLQNRPGFWVTGRNAAMPMIARASDSSLPAYSQIITPHTELRSMFLIEASRGCSRGCTYCVMRRTTNRGMRRVSLQRVLERIPEHARKVGLVGAAVTDNPEISEIVEALVESGRQVSVSSLRAERLNPRLVKLLARGGYRTLTVAIDGASKRLREAIDRKTTEQNIIDAARMAREAGLQRIKVYAMIGLPGETEADIDELASLASEIAAVLPVSLGVAPFAAKRNTPLDGAPFEPVALLDAKVARLKRKLRGRAEIRPTSPKWAFVEYMLAQCGPEAGLAAFDAWKAGGSFASWKRAFEERGARPSRQSPAVDGRLRIPDWAWMAGSGR